MKKTPLFIFSFLLLLIATGLFAQQYPKAMLWKKCIGGSQDDKANDVLLDPDGSIVVVGYSGSNDGDVSNHHGAIGSKDAWIAKLDTYGNLVWQKSIGGTGDDEFHTIILTRDGNYLCTGSTYSSDGDVPYNNGSSDCFVVKISRAGDIIWSRNFGGQLNELGVDAVALNDGSYAVLASAASYDGDIQSKTYGKTDADAWVFKLNNTGDLIWENSIDHGEMTISNIGYNIMEANDSSLFVYTHGESSYSQTIHPIGTSDEITYYFTDHPTVAYKVDKNTGNSIYSGNISGDADFSICKTADSYFYAYQQSFHSVTGGQEMICSFKDAYAYWSKIGGGGGGNIFSYQNFAPFNYCNYQGEEGEPVYTFAPTHGIAAASITEVTTAGIYNPNPDSYIYLDKADAWTSKFGTFGGYNEDAFTSVKINPLTNEYVVVGYTNSKSGDVTGLHEEVAGLTHDCWVIKFGMSNTIKGNVFLDNNNNGVRDAGEPVFGAGKMKTVRNGVVQYATGSQDNYTNVVNDIGIYTSTLETDNPYFVSTRIAGKVTNFSTFGSTDTINFPVKMLPGKKDYTVSVTSKSSPRPGFDMEYIVTWANKGTDTLQSKTIRFIKDNRSQYEYIAAPVTISGDTLSWNVNNVIPGQKGSFSFFVKMDAVPQLNVGDTITASAYIDSTGDLAHEDNYALYRQQVKGSFDPNDKTESHGGFITPLEMKQEQCLTYTVRFQNLGNDAAYTVVIRDTLDNKLDPASFEMVSASHPYKLSLQYGKNAKWTFENINLPDSITSDSLSRGYVTYRVKPRPGFVTGDTIRNSASIYFDFNPPVSTNTQLTVFTAVPCVWTGAISNAWENSLNWANGKVPDEGSDVYIDGGNVVTPQINSHAACRSIHINPNATLQVNTGYDLKVGGEYLPLVH